MIRLSFTLYPTTVNINPTGEYGDPYSPDLVVENPRSLLWMSAGGTFIRDRHVRMV